MFLETGWRSCGSRNATGVHAVRGLQQSQRLPQVQHLGWRHGRGNTQVVNATQRGSFCVNFPEARDGGVAKKTQTENGTHEGDGGVAVF